MCAVDVQQQSGGDDCGLFSIAFAAVQAKNLDPRCCIFRQSAMRTALVRSLEAGNIGELVDNVTEVKSKKASDSHLFQWTCRTYCHCRLPDIGGKMVQCSDCNKWYHYSCENSSFEASDWICQLCRRTRGKA